MDKETAIIVLGTAHRKIVTASTIGSRTQNLKLNFLSLILIRSFESNVGRDVFQSQISQIGSIVLAAL